MSNINDYRINSLNLYVETTFGEYLQYARDLVKNNDLQRKRVKTSKNSLFFVENRFIKWLCNSAISVSNCRI